MNLTSNLTVGADPEGFVKEGNKTISAYNLIPGDKKNPYPVEGGALQVDGMAVEFNIDPSRNYEEFNNNIDKVLLMLDKELNKKGNYSVSFQPVARFSKRYMSSQPKEAILLGCDPDFNAWTLKTNPPPDEASLIRTAAGHIHIGFTHNSDPFSGQHIGLCSALAKQLDFFLGAYSILEDNDKDSPIRRDMYGKAGAFRPKTYGLEYRVLSNFWVKDKKKRKDIFNLTTSALKAFEKNFFLFQSEGEDIQNILNNSDKRKAKELFDKMKRKGFIHEV